MRVITVIAAAYATGWHATATAHVLSVGIQAPVNDAQECLSAFGWWTTASHAVSAVNDADWWKQFGVTLALELVPSDTQYDAWINADRFAEPSSLACGNATLGDCKVLRGAIVGPATSASTTAVQLVSRVS